MFFFFGPTFLFLLLFLGWSGFCVFIGYQGRKNEDFTRFVERTLGKRPPPDDDPGFLARR